MQQSNNGVLANLLTPCLIFVVALGSGAVICRQYCRGPLHQLRLHPVEMFGGLEAEAEQAVTNITSETTNRMNGSTGHTTCSLLGTEYDCSALLDWQYYAKQHMSANISNSTDALQHWLSAGIAQGSRSHAGERVLKLVLMTKNAWPLVRSWVLYHADTFGASNLYILDGSNKTSQSYSWLQQAADKLGVHVFHTGHMGFDEISKSIEQLLNSLRWSADYLVKLDTDEFIGVLHESDSCRDPALSCKAPEIGLGPDVRKYVDELEVLGGKMLRINYTMYSIPAASCPIDPTDLTVYAEIVVHGYPSRGHMSLPATQKTTFVAPTFQDIDLGAHGGNVQPEYRDAGWQAVGLVLMHFQHTCYEDLVAGAELAILAHKYITESMPRDERLAKCRGPLTKAVASFHKVLYYCQSLEDADAARRKYLEQFKSIPKWRFDSLAKYIKQLEARYDACHLQARDC